MILVAGGTGLLGTQVVRLLTARGLQLRVLTRDDRDVRTRSQVRTSRSSRATCARAARLTGR